MTAPRPLPPWFWKWAAWDLGRGEYRGHRRSPSLRPSTGAPKRIPSWAPAERDRRWPTHHLPPVPPPAPPPSRSPSKGKGVLYYYNSVNADHDVVASAKRYGFAVAVLVHEGPDVVSDEHNDPDLLHRLKDAGVVAIATGFAKPDGDYGPVADAIARGSDGYDEYMANVENAWGYGTPGFGESEKLVPAIRAATNIHLSVAIENREPLHFAPWVDAGLEVIRPECYMNEQAGQTLVMAVAAAGQYQADLPDGLRPDQVEPLLGKYGQWMQPLSAWRVQVDAGLSLGVRCCGVWAAEFADDPDVSTLASYKG